MHGMSTTSAAVRSPRPDRPPPVAGRAAPGQPPRPRIPKELYQPSLPWTLAFLVYAPLLFVVPAYLAYALASSTVPLPLRAAGVIPLTILAGFGIQLMGFAGHEGLHFSLFRRKLVSAAVGVAYAAALPTYFEMAFAMQHWNHHRFTNQASDPDITIVAGLRYWWQRVLLTRLYYNFHYIGMIFRVAFGGSSPYPYKLPLSPAAVRALCWFNIALSLTWLVGYAAITVYDPMAGVFGIWLPVLAAMLITGIQPYIDHGDTGVLPLQSAWSRTSPLMRILYFGGNHHLEHHLYPGVPCYRLPAVHAFLRERGVLADSGARIEPSFVRAYRNLAATYAPRGDDLAFDPFQVSEAIR